MPGKLNLDGKEYEINKLSENGKYTLSLFRHSINRIDELENMSALLQRAKNSYINSLKKEILSTKTGMFFEDE